MLRAVFGWEAAALRATIGRDAAWLVLAAFPASMLLPLTAGAFFTEWLQGAMILGWVYTFVAVAKSGRHAGRLRDSALWVFQKGHDLADFALARFIFAILITAALIVYLSVWYVVGALVHAAFSPAQLLAFSSTVAVVALISLAVLFLAGALRMDRGSDFLILIAIASLLQDAFARLLPAWAATVLDIVLPPFPHASVVVTSIAAGQPADALGAALHIMAFLGVCIGTAASLHARWRPRLASSS